MASADNGRTMIIVTYVLHLIGAVSGLLSIIALILNYVKLGDNGDLADSHHRWMIRTFWWTCLGFVVAFVMFITVIGIPLAYLVCLVAWVWYIYRHVRGLIYLGENKAMPKS